MNYFDSWQELKQAFIDNFIATCEQPGNKYDLQRIRDRKDEPLREYIRRFSEMRIKVPSISDNKANEAFITGLHFHDALRDKLLHKRPELVIALLATAKKYADADDAKKIIIEEAARVPRFDHPHTTTTTAATVVGTTILTAATSATTPTTIATNVISGVTAVTITGASVLGKMTTKSTSLRKVVDVATMKMTMPKH